MLVCVSAFQNYCHWNNDDYVYCISLLATAMMSRIIAESENRSLRAIYLNWTPPVFVPYKFKLSWVCKILCAPLPYSTKILYLDGRLTRQVITSLRPGTHCAISFRAMYNPASLDSGVILVAHTAIESEGYDQLLSYFHLVYLFCM